MGDRRMFNVELRPYETTIVSWRKLVKDANKLDRNTTILEPHSSTIAPGQSTERDLKDEPAPHRFSTLIEKIERLYMGKQSSDEEDLSDFPDDNQYDTEDSFIDDADLDEYFEVDNSTTKHKGFFVNRGILERINEPIVSPNQLRKKRKKKEGMKSHDKNDTIHLPNKHLKLAKKATGRLGGSKLSKGKYSSFHSPSIGLTREYSGDVMHSKQIDDFVPSANMKSVNTRTALDSCCSSQRLNDDGYVTLTEGGVERKKTGSLKSKNRGSKMKNYSGLLNRSYQKNHYTNSHALLKSQSGRQLISANDQELAVREKQKNGCLELPDLNKSEVKGPVQTAKTQYIHRKDGPSARPKSSMLEKAIRELEKMVAESRPPRMEIQDVDTSAQAVKKRLPREIKQKLAKVARLAHSTQGKVTKELLNRLMSILGHVMQLSTLKRNLKIMINMGLAAKKQRDDLFQHIKKEVDETIKMQLPCLKSEASEQLVAASDDFQKCSSEEKATLERKISITSTVEDKICDLYDLYIDGFDEDAGQQIRKLYVELVRIWPNGIIDNHGIKRAICRAKDRRKALYYQQREIKCSKDEGSGK